MKKFIILLLLFICINGNCQSIDEILTKFEQIQSYARHRLLNYRSYRYRPLQDFSSELPFSFGLTHLDNPSYNGFDLSTRGVFSDSSMQMRILQLLNNEFYDGEVDDLWKKDMQKNNYANLTDSLLHIKRIERETCYKKYIDENELVDLLEICTYINNKQIIKRIEEIYKDTTYRKNWADAYACLVANHIEPYTSECLKKYRYKKEQSYEEQVLACNYLWLIQTQQSFRYLSEYLFSDKYYTNIICEDNTYECESLDDIIVEIDCESGVADTIIKCENNTNKGDTLKYDIDVDYIDLEDEDTNPIIAEWEYKTYLYWGVFSIIQKSILNLDLYDMLGITNDIFVSQEFLTEETRKKIYNWMQENYGKYKIKNRW